jgi:hypothetical protein
LGDIIVAERTFSYTPGKVERDERGRSVLLRDTTTWQLQPALLHSARMFESWQNAVKNIEVERPLSHRQQRDWLLDTLLHTEHHNLLLLNEQERQRYAPDWKLIWRQLSKVPLPYLTAEGLLTERAAELRYGTEFPYVDQQQPHVHIVPVATGDQIRADNPFEQIRMPVRTTIALDMEGAAFYRAMADHVDIPALFVKGICDYADSEQDNSFHLYACAVSAAYMLSFIRTFVTTTRFPDRRK